ncbi:MAG: response regulator [Thermodesulfobacteriota bacterium]
MIAPRILIAEDEKHIRLALSLLLRQQGYEVEMAADGGEAFRRLSHPDAPPFHLLITDLQMPELDGLELIDRLTARKITIPVIVITGYGNRLVADMALSRHCAAYLDKPFQPAEILRRVADVLYRPTRTIRPIPLAS